MITRRNFIQQSLSAGIGLAALNRMPGLPVLAGSKMKFGLVTYMWGADWDLPTLIANCEKTGYQGIELRVQHAHKVEINLTAAQRAEVKKRFADSQVKCVGYGSNFEFHSPDPAQVRKNIEESKECVKLCSDIGATGLKVKPNDLPAGVPKEKTIAQIGASLNEIGRFARDYGQLIRVEVHGNLCQRPGDLAVDQVRVRGRPLDHRAQRGVFALQERVGRVKDRDGHFRLRHRQRRGQVRDAFRSCHNFAFCFPSLSASIGERD